MEAKKKKRISTAIKGGAGDDKSRKKKAVANIYTALLSHVSGEFLKRMQISTIAFKDGIQYHDVFHGIEAVVSDGKEKTRMNEILTHKAELYTGHPLHK